VKNFGLLGRCGWAHKHFAHNIRYIVVATWRIHGLILTSDYVKFCGSVLVFFLPKLFDVSKFRCRPTPPLRVEAGSIPEIYRLGNKRLERRINGILRNPLLSDIIIIIIMKKWGARGLAVLSAEVGLTP